MAHCALALEANATRQVLSEMSAMNTSLARLRRVRIWITNCFIDFLQSLCKAVSSRKATPPWHLLVGAPWEGSLGDDALLQHKSYFLFQGFKTRRTLDLIHLHTFTVVPSLLTLSKGYASLATSCTILMWCNYLEFLLLQGSFRLGRYSNQMKFEAKYVFRFSNCKSSQPQSWLHDMCSNTVQQNAKELRWPTGDTWKEAYREKEAVHRHCNGRGTNNGLNMKHNLLFCSQTIAGQKTSVLCLVHSATRTTHRLDGSSNVVFWLWVVCFRLFLLQLFHCCNGPHSPDITRSSAFTQSALSYFRGRWRCPA